MEVLDEHFRFDSPISPDARAVVYVRQSTPQQISHNQESLKLQYALKQRVAARVA